MKRVIEFPAVWVIAVAGFLLAGSQSLRAQTLPTLTATPTALNFTYQVGTATLPAAIPVLVKKSTTGTELPFIISSTPVTMPSWLIVVPTSMTGTTNTAFSVRVNPSPLTAGSYTATLTVTAAGAAAPINIPVTLVVKNPPPDMTVSNAGPLAFTFATNGAAPAAQTFSVNSTGEPISVSATAVSTGGWLSASKSSAVAVAGFPVTVTASIVTTGLLPGSYTGKINITSTNAVTKTITVNVNLTVTPAPAIVSSIWPNPVPIGTNDITVTIRGQYFYPSPVVMAGTTRLVATLVSETVLLAVMPKALLGVAGSFALTVSSPSQTASTPVTLSVGAAQPVIAAVTNAASFTSDVPGGTANSIAPGEIISIFGSAMGPDTLMQGVIGGTPAAYATTLGTAPNTVIVELELTPGVWTAAPLIFAQATQINAVVPFSLVSGGTVNLRVTYGGATSASFPLTTVNTNPGLFTIDASGAGAAAILNQDYSLNSLSNAAAKGSTVMIYLTGGGVTTAPQPTPDGVILASSMNLAATPTVTIGGVATTVTAAVLPAQSVAGLVQINAQVPSTVLTGRALPVIVTIGGRASPATATMVAK